MRIKAVIISLSLFFAGTGLFSMTGDEAVAKFRKRMNAPGNITGSISWTTLGGQTFSGNFKFMPPNKLYIKFTYPPGKTLITNGEKLWIYNTASNICGVQDLAQGTSSGGIAAFVTGYRSITSTGKDGYTIKLKNDEKHYSEINLVVDRSFFLKMAVFRTASGKVFTVTISNVTVSKKMDPGLFNFVIPKDVRIVKNPLNLL